MYRYFKQPLIVLFIISFSGMINAGIWEPGPPLNTPRTGASAVVLDGYIYILGGKTTNGVILNTVEKYDPVTMEWTFVAPFDRPRVNAAAVVLDGQIYILGGRDDENEVLKKMETYNPSTNSWDEVRQMDNHREGHLAAILRGSICVMGGKDEYNYFVQEIEWYVKASDEWYTAPSNLIHPRQFPFASSVNDTIYMFGGFNPVPSNASYKGTADPSWSFTWNPISPLQQGRGYGATTQLNDEIFLIGGRTLDDTTAIVEKYNLTSQQIEIDTPLPSPRMGLTAVTLDDAIYAIGGSYQNQPMATVYIYQDALAIDPPSTSEIPTDFAQINGYPNPFNGIIQLEINVPQTGSNELAVYDVQGRKIKTLHKGSLPAGMHNFQWAGTNAFNIPVATGVYFAILKGKQYVKSFKMVYVR